jgi:hypothetical protein
MQPTPSQTSRFQLLQKGLGTSVVVAVLAAILVKPFHLAPPPLPSGIPILVFQEPMPASPHLAEEEAAIWGEGRREIARLTSLKAPTAAETQELHHWQQLQRTLSELEDVQMRLQLHEQDSAFPAPAYRIRQQDLKQALTQLYDSPL